MNITDNSVSGLEDSSDDDHDVVQALPRGHIIQHPVIVANGNNDDDMQVFALIPPVNNANAGNNVHAQGQGNGDAVNGQAQDNGLGVQVNQMEGRHEFSGEEGDEESACDDDEWNDDDSTSTYNPPIEDDVVVVGIRNQRGLGDEGDATDEVEFVGVRRDDNEHNNSQSGSESSSRINIQDMPQKKRTCFFNEITQAFLQSYHSQDFSNIEEIGTVLPTNPNGNCMVESMTIGMVNDDLISRDIFNITHEDRSSDLQRLRNDPRTVRKTLFEFLSRNWRQLSNHDSDHDQDQEVMIRDPNGDPISYYNVSRKTLLYGMDVGGRLFNEGSLYLPYCSSSDWLSTRDHLPIFALMCSRTCISYSMTSANKSTTIAYFNVDEGVVTVYTVEGRFVTGPSINSICIYHSGPGNGNHFEFVQLHSDAGGDFNTAVQVASATGLHDSNDEIVPMAAASRIGEFIQLVGGQLTASRAHAIYTKAAGGDFEMVVQIFLTGKSDSVIEDWDAFGDLVSGDIESESLAHNIFFDQANCDYDAAVRIHLHNSNDRKLCNNEEQKQGGKWEDLKEYKSVQKTRFSSIHEEWGGALQAKTGKSKCLQLS